MSTRAEWLSKVTPHLIADVVLYPAESGGRQHDAFPGWGCPCMVSQSEPLTGYDAWPILDAPLKPGDSRRLGFVFAVGELAQTIREAGKFYLWEGHFIGEAVVVSPTDKSAQ